MADTIALNIPKDATVRALCNDLHKMREGLAALGLQAHILDQVGAKLKDLASEVERLKSDRAYVSGRKDGWDAAMATGIAGQPE